MRAKAIAAVAASTAIAALLLPVGALAQAAAPAHKNHPTIVAAFQVRGSNGYSVNVNLKNRSVLSVSTAIIVRPSIVASQYRLGIHQSPGSNRIKASLGKLGRIDMRFVPESSYQEEPLFPICKGEKEAVEEGHYVGLFEFRGEHGYTRTRVTRAPGSVAVTPAPTCHHRPAGHGPHKRGPRPREGLAGRALSVLAKAKKTPEVEAHGLVLTVKTSNPRVEFQGFRLSAADKMGKGTAFETFLAGASRNRGRIKEESLVLDLFVRGPYFKVPDLSHLTSEVVVAPPAPFLGSATLRQESAQESDWDGDLRVNLPGFGVLPLTGPTAQVTMCADAGCHVPK